MSMARPASASKPAKPAEHTEVPMSAASISSCLHGRSRAQRGNVLISGAGPA